MLDEQFMESVLSDGTFKGVLINDMVTSLKPRRRYDELEEPIFTESMRAQLLDSVVADYCLELSAASKFRVKQLKLSMVQLMLPTRERRYTFGKFGDYPETHIVDALNDVGDGYGRRVWYLDNCMRDYSVRPSSSHIASFVEMIIAIEQVEKAIKVLQTKFMWSFNAHLVKPSELFQGPAKRRRLEAAGIAHIFEVNK